jgi:DNA-binding transcriptional LysR family regulator
MRQSTAPGVSWDRLRVFLTVAEHGSFTQAGRHLDLSQSAVSRQINALENSLKVSLFHRHARGLMLTEQGEDLLATVREMNALLGMGLARINESSQQPQGPLRITTTLAFGSAWLTSRMNVFHTLFPDVAVSLLLADNLQLDLSLRQADLAIRFEPQTQLNLIQRHLMTIRYHVFATADYLERHGVPATAADLDGHELIVYGEDVPQPVPEINWLLEAGADPDRPREPALRVNSVYGIFRAVESGMGIAALPYYMSDESGKLVEILEDLEGPSIEAYLVYPEELRHSKRIAVVRDFLLRQVDEDSRRVGPSPLRPAS